MSKAAFQFVFKNLRSECGLTQKQAASELGVSASTVAMWETGMRYPSPILMEKIAEYFNVNIDDLYGRIVSDNDLTDIEKNLIERYRALDETQKNMLHRALNLKLKKDNNI